MSTISATHLIYLPSCGLWISAIRVLVNGEAGWRFRNSTDAALWLQEQQEQDG